MRKKWKEAISELRMSQSANSANHNRIDYEIKRLESMVSDLKRTVNLLMDHLGLKIDQPKVRIIKRQDNRGTGND